MDTEELINMLSSSDTYIRGEAARQLGYRRDHRAVAPLATALLKERDYQNDTLQSMIQALGEIGGVEAAEALAESLISR